MENDIKAIIFDMGGVILRTRDELPRKELAEMLGITLEQLKKELFFSDSAIKSEEGYLHKYDHWKNILRNHGITNYANLKEFDEKFWSGDCPDQKLISYIGKLKGEFALGMISNAFMGAREWIESHYHFTELFDFTVFSYELKIRKPDPEIYLFACKKLKVEPKEAIFIDDMLINVEGACKVGLYGIQFHDQEQLESELNKTIRQINGLRGSGNE